MGFKKGDKNINRDGRKKGTPNKYSLDVKTAMADLVAFNLDKLQDDLDEMSPKDRAAVIMKMSDKVIPSLKAIDNTVEVKGTQSLGFDINYSDESKGVVGKEDKADGTKE